MKIAILILAHKNKEQLERLLSVLRHDNVDIYVHVDKKAPFCPSDVVFGERVVFTENRHDVGLFGFSMVQAEFELIHTARQHGQYQYFIMMSAQCYPIAHIDYIYNYLSERYPEPFIEAVSPTQTNYVKKNFKHVYLLKQFKMKAYDFLRNNFSNKAYKILRCFPAGFVFLVSGIKELFVKSPKKRLQKKGYPLYCGSQWWILPDSLVDKACEEYQSKYYCNAVSDSYSCDETFFQTAVMKYEKNNSIQVDQDGNYMNRRWFYIFKGGHPIPLTKEHYDQIINSGMLFARKFDANIDSDILDMIDKHNQR